MMKIWRTRKKYSMVYSLKWSAVMLERERQKQNNIDRKVRVHIDQRYIKTSLPNRYLVYWICETFMRFSDWYVRFGDWCCVESISYLSLYDHVRVNLKPRTYILSFYIQISGLYSLLSSQKILKMLTHNNNVFVVLHEGNLNLRPKGVRQTEYVSKQLWI
jgi:hypothetical protein